MKIKAICLGLALGVLSTAAQAETTLRPGSKSLQRTSSISEFKDVLIEAEIWDTEQRMAQEIASWREYYCDYIPADGAGNWRGYFELPLNDKPRALYQAISGMTLAQAQEIVKSRNGYFQDKPVNWNAFKKEIERVENDLDLHGLYWDVVYTNGDINVRNLGYGWGSQWSMAPAKLPAGANALASADITQDPWNGYFDLPKADKAQALVNSISAMDLDTARRIVDGGYLKDEPATWEDFKKEIKKIQSDLGVSGLYDRIVAKNGSENKRRLYSGAASGGGDFNNGGGSSGGQPPANGGGGDFNNGGGSSGGQPPASGGGGDFNNGGGSSGGQPPSNGGGGDFNNGGGSQPGNGGGDFNNGGNTPPSAPSYNCGYRDEYRLVWRLRTFEKLVEKLPKRVDVFFEGGTLLSGESEVITLRWDGKSESVTVDKSSAINNYGVSVDSRGSVYRLKAEGRKAISPSRSDFTYSFDVSGMKLTVTDSRSEELSKLSNGNNSIKVSFKVVQKGGTCSKNKVVATVSQTVPTDGIVNFASSLNPAAETGSQYRVESVTVERLGTEYFSGSVELGSTEFQKH